MYYVRVVQRGEALLDPIVTQPVITHIREQEKLQDRSAFAMLTGREQEVLRLVAKGKSNVDIASTLFISAKTVRNHITSILANWKRTLC